MSDVESLRRQVTMLNETLHRKNIMLDALHYVWCDGGCGGGGDAEEKANKKNGPCTPGGRSW